MALPNHNQIFLPLCGGIGIFNPQVNQPGTLGMVVTSDGRDRWILSCFHVLCSGAGVEAIYQPDDVTGTPVANTDPARANQALDCAAARVHANIAASGEILGIGTLVAPVEPVVGMRVLKSGAETGVTQGTITDITGNRVEIEASNLPVNYLLSEVGDSGAVWVEREQRAPVVLHQAGSKGPRRFACGIPIKLALQTLGLSTLA